MTKYDSSSIQTLKFPDSVRNNPSMYLGGTDEHGRFVVLREFCDNAVDEFLAGRNSSIQIAVEDDGSYWILDEGGGIPQGTKVTTVNVNGKDVKSKMPTMQAVFGELHTSGKFQSEAYKTSIGCFAGETPIELVDGRILTMRQIYKEHKQGIQNYVWTISRKTGDLRAQPIERALITGKTRHLVEVILDNGSKFRCTPDHPLYQSNLKKIEAEESVGASLFALDFEYDKDGYRVLPVKGDWPVRLHRVVAEYNGLEIEDKHVHHLDENKLNNEPHNLETLTPLEHYLEHPEKLEIWMKYLARSGHEKSKLLNRRNSKSWYIKLQQQGKAMKIACRVVWLGKPVTKKTFNANRFHGAPSWSKAVRRFSSPAELIEVATALVAEAKSKASRFAFAAKFLQSLEFTPGLSERATCYDQSALMRAKRVVGKAVALLERMPPANATAEELNACFGAKSKGAVGARGLSQYIDLDEFVSAVRNEVDPCNFLYTDQSDEACRLRKNKFDKDDATTRVVGWGIAAVSRQSRQFLRNLNAMLADGEHVSQANYHERFKNAAGNSSWYLGVKACARRGIRGREDVLAAAKEENHKVVKVRHIYLDEETPVYDLSIGIDHNYRLACGVFVGNTHGVGVKGSNATAEYLHVWTSYKGAWHTIRFERGILKTPVATGKAPKTPFGVPKKGTAIHFKPDQKIFSVKSFPPSMLVSWAEIQAYLNPGLKVTVSIKGKTKTWFTKEGPKAWIAKRLETLKAEAEADLFVFNNELATAAIAFSNCDGFEVKGFTNGLQNSQGGKHVNSVTSALFEALKEYAGKAKFTQNDLADGMLGIVNAKLHKPSFSSQDKAKLTDDRMGAEFQVQVLKEAEKFFKANKAMAKRLVERATKIAELKGKFKANKAMVTALNKMKRSGLPPNYAPCARGIPIKDRELLIVEGDSAAGGLREVRAPNQALLPLKGKVFNVMKRASKGIDKALASQAILNILAAIGFDPKAEDPLRKLQVGRIIFLSDADPDGYHINALLNALVAEMMPGAYDLGLVYVADMPEFYSITKGNLFVGSTLSEVQDKMKDAGARGEVSHAKGWGEVDPEVLRVLVASPARRLIKIDPLTPEDLQTFRSLMGKSEEAPADDADDKPKKGRALKSKEAAAEKADKTPKAKAKRKQKEKA